MPLISTLGARAILIQHEKLLKFSLAMVFKYFLPIEPFEWNYKKYSVFKTKQNYSHIVQRDAHICARGTYTTTSIKMHTHAEKNCMKWTA
jgi:hypothetical protein